MDKKREDFLARLRETFRAEASEHLEAITAGLLALERADAAERAPIVEIIFREAHSLKGAARSVSLADVEALCMELESIFAGMKRGELSISPEMLDLILPAISVLAGLCGKPGATRTIEEEGKVRNALESLRRIPLIIAGLAADKPVAAPPGENPKSGEPPPFKKEVPAGEAYGKAAAPPGEARTAPHPPATDTVRVSIRKIGDILLEAEELLSSKMAAGSLALELRALSATLSDWNRKRMREAAKYRRGPEGASAAFDFFESGTLFTRDLENSLRKLAGAAQQEALSLAAATDRLLDSTRNVLLLPCSHLLGALPKLARDLARAQGKDAGLIIYGEDIEIDRRVLDELKDPLIHLLRNAIDHGIETPDKRKSLGKPEHGTITITASPIEGNRFLLTVADDGAGIDAEKVGKAAARLQTMAAGEGAGLPEEDAAGLIFQSGLSTSPIITDLSGRGLGLAIVREKVEKLGGTVSAASIPGSGTTFSMVAPLSLATFRGVFVETAGRRYVIPTASVERVGRVKPGETATVENRATVEIGGRAVSLVRLRDVLELTGPDVRNDGALPMVLIRAGDRQIAFLVDKVLGEQEVMVKNLGKHLVKVRNVAGASISGSGGIVPILNVSDLVDSAAVSQASGTAGAGGGARPERRARLLIAEDSITARTLIKSVLEGAGYEVVAAVDGMDALTRLRTEPFDLLVSDVDMPRMNGFELTSKIRADKNFSKLPVVLVTALGSRKDREYGIEVGANAYIVKTDFDQGNLLEIIHRLV